MPSRSIASSMATGPASSAASGPSSSVTSPAGRSQAPVMNHTPSSPSAKAMAAPPGTSSSERFGARYAFCTASDSSDTPRWIPSSRGIHGASRPSGSRNGSSGRGIRPPTTCQTSATTTTPTISASDGASRANPQSASNAPGSSTNHFSCANGSDGTPTSSAHLAPKRFDQNRPPVTSTREGRRLSASRTQGRATGRAPERRVASRGRERPQHGQGPFAQPLQPRPTGNLRPSPRAQRMGQLAQRPHLLLHGIHRFEVGHQRLHPHPDHPEPPPEVPDARPWGGGEQPRERAIALEQGGELGGPAAVGGEVGAAERVGGEASRSGGDPSGPGRPGRAWHPGGRRACRAPRARRPGRRTARRPGGHRRTCGPSAWPRRPARPARTWPTRRAPPPAAGPGGRPRPR